MQFENSQPTVLEQLQLFTAPPTEASLVRNELIEYRPTSQVSDTSVIEFRVCPQENQYVDLKRSLLKITFKLLKSDGTNIPATAKVGIVNNFLHSMFAQDDVLLNQVLISPSSNNYPYKAYLDYTLQNSIDNNKIQNSWIYYKDRAGAMENTDPLTGPNTGLTNRFGLIAGSKLAHALGPLRSDLCTMDRWILPGVDITIRLWPTKSLFRLMKPSTEAGDFNVKIEDIVFLANKITVKPEIVQAQEQILKTVTAKYPFTRSRVHAYNIASGATFFRQDQLFQDERPDRVIVGIVDSSGYQGNYEKNPFNFQNAGLKNIDLTVDDQSMNGRLINTDFTKGDFLELYYGLNSNQGFDGLGVNGPNVTVGDYDEGYAIYVFDEYAGLSSNKNFVTDIRKGNTKLIINFSAATTTALTVIVYGQFNDMFEIDSTRKIIVR